MLCEPIQHDLNKPNHLPIGMLLAKANGIVFDQKAILCDCHLNPDRPLVAWVISPPNHPRQLTALARYLQLYDMDDRLRYRRQAQHDDHLGQKNKCS